MTECNVPAGSQTPYILPLENVVPASVPIVLGAYLDRIAQAVRADVGDGVFAGSAVNDGDRPEVTVTIYGTNSDLIVGALCRIDTAYRDRFTMIETTYSTSDMDSFAVEARDRLDVAEIPASVVVESGVDAVVVYLETPDGEPDDALATDVLKLLAEIPSVIRFNSPMTELVPSPSTD